MVTHPGNNRVWCSATTLIEANALLLSQTANCHCASIHENIDAEYRACVIWVLLQSQFIVFVPLPIFGKVLMTAEDARQCSVTWLAFVQWMAGVNPVRLLKLCTCLTLDLFHLRFRHEWCYIVTFCSSDILHIWRRVCLTVFVCVYVPYSRQNGWDDQDQTWHTDSPWPMECFDQVEAKVQTL